MSLSPDDRHLIETILAEALQQMLEAGKAMKAQQSTARVLPLSLVCTNPDEVRVVTLEDLVIRREVLTLVIRQYAAVGLAFFTDGVIMRLTDGAPPTKEQALLALYVTAWGAGRAVAIPYRPAFFGTAFDPPEEAPQVLATYQGLFG